VTNLSTKIKQFSIVIGAYTLARQLSRRLRPQEQRAFSADIALYKSLSLGGALAFDIGANLGDKSEALLRNGARVIAFEPNPLVVRELRARCSAYESWTLVQAALGSGSKISILHAQEIHSQSSLAADWEDGNVIAHFAVPVVTLDAAIECFGLPDYCKIDVEGWELEVLRGLTQQIKLLSFEFHLDDKGIRNARSCLELLAEFGPSRLNLTLAEGAKFFFDEWVPLDEFLARFPGNLMESLSGNAYGDIFVRSLV